jgi:hypothetical protein
MNRTRGDRNDRSANQKCLIANERTAIVGLLCVAPLGIGNIAPALEKHATVPADTPYFFLVVVLVKPFFLTSGSSAEVVLSRSQAEAMLVTPRPLYFFFLFVVFLGISLYCSGIN